MNFEICFFFNFLSNSADSVDLRTGSRNIESYARNRVQSRDIHFVEVKMEMDSDNSNINLEVKEETLSDSESLKEEEIDTDNFER